MQNPRETLINKMTRKAAYTYSLPTQIAHNVCSFLDDPYWDVGASTNFTANFDEFTQDFAENPFMGTRRGHRINFVLGCTSALVTLGLFSLGSMVKDTFHKAEKNWIERVKVHSVEHAQAR